MNSRILINDMISYQKGNKAVGDEIVCRFSPLLKRYASLLHYEDAFYDLQLYFIEFMYSQAIENKFDNDYCLLAYLKKSIRNAYIQISQRMQVQNTTLRFYNQLSDEEIHSIETDNAAYDDYFSSEYDFINNLLTEKERITIYRLYIMDYSVAEVAKMDNTTRQTANRTKNRALNKLRKYLNCLS